LISIRTVSECETQDVGIMLGSILKKGDIVGLEGELGAGKTVFVKGMAAALGVKEYVTSPTFVILNEYKGRLPVYHFDVYRVSNPQDMYDIGFDEYIYSDGVVIVEWADLIREILPAEIVWVKIKRSFYKKDNTGKTNNKAHNGLIEEERILHMSFIGEKYHEYENCLVLGMGKEVDKD
jgi:tRNA threonylcarbamoyladenosine biosynthesis protein TsaE